VDTEQATEQIGVALWRVVPARHFSTDATDSINLSCPREIDSNKLLMDKRTCFDYGTFPFMSRPLVFTDTLDEGFT
jgi:hypothetical protein